MRKQESISYTNSNWGNFINQVRHFHNIGKTSDFIAKELNVSENLIIQSIKLHIQKLP